MRTPNLKRTYETLQYIIDYQQKNGKMPSFRTIKIDCKYTSMNTLAADIDRLKKRNELIVDKDNNLHLPLSKEVRKQIATLVNEIRRGAETDEANNKPVVIELPAALFGEELNRVILKANDNDMSSIGIFNGDWLIVKKEPIAHEGDVIIAYFSNGDYTCKRLCKNDDGFYLESTNPDSEPIMPTDDWFIYGVVKHVIHKL